jgi:glutathione S-transferase
VNPYHKPASLLALNPRGLVPSLKWHDKALYESTAILQFLEEAYPQHPPRLMPEDPYQRWRVRIWMDFVGTRFIPGFHRFLQCQGGEEDVGEKRQEFLGFVKEIAKQMDSEGPFFLGKEFTMFDTVLAPWAIRLWVFDHFKGGLGIPDEGKGGEDEETWKRWRTWVQAVSERRSVKETTSERKHYLPIYQRYADDKAQSELAKATRAGKGVP